MLRGYKINFLMYVLTFTVDLPLNIYKANKNSAQKISELSLASNEETGIYPMSL